MRMLMAVVTALSVLGLAFWAYRENYATKAALDDMRLLQKEIAEARETLSVLKAEWAYLNRPERLSALADANFAELQLLELEPTQFTTIRQVAFPQPAVTTPLDPSLGPITEPIALSGALTETN